MSTNNENQTVTMEESTKSIFDYKTSVGISVAACAAFIYLIQVIGGYIPALLVLYFLTREVRTEYNKYLIKTSVKALALDSVFTGVIFLLSTLTSIVPGLLTTILTTCRLTEISEVISNVCVLPVGLINLFGTILNYTKIIVFIICIFHMLKKKDVRVPFIDDIYDKITA